MGDQEKKAFVFRLKPFSFKVPMTARRSLDVSNTGR